jgi:hypothetical protein
VDNFNLSDAISWHDFCVMTPPLNGLGPMLFCHSVIIDFLFITSATVAHIHLKFHIWICSVWNNHTHDRSGSIKSAAGDHISLPRRVKISFKKNLEVLNLLIVIVTKFSGLVDLHTCQVFRF